VNPPRGLSAPARAAWREAVATLSAVSEDPELSRGAIGRYAAAVEQCDTLETQWRAAGRPGTGLGGATGQASVPHPLLAQMLAARKQAAELGDVLGLDPQARRRLSRRTGAGRPPGAASAQDRAPSPRRTLRSVR